MKLLRLLILLGFLCMSTYAQTPKIEGAWYGTINPPGVQFDIAINFQKIGDDWTGTLMMENGNSLQLKDVKATGNAVSFSVAV